MKALTWKEPYTSLMLCGKIETRTWKTNYRGPVLICASKKSYIYNDVAKISGPYQYDRIMKAFNSDRRTPYFGTYNNWSKNNGFAIAIGNLVDCRPMKPTDEDDCFVTYHPDLWCHIYEDVRAIVPIPFKGKQGWSKVDSSIIKQLEYVDQELAAKIVLKKLSEEKF